MADVPLSDPTIFNPETIPIGLGPPEVTKAIWVDSVGTTVIGLTDDNSQLRLAVSLVGEQNKTGAATHHMFLFDAEMVGLTLAQLLFYSLPLGEEVQTVFDARMVELEASMEEDHVDDNPEEVREDTVVTANTDGSDPNGMGTTEVDGNTAIAAGAVPPVADHEQSGTS